MVSRLHSYIPFPYCSIINANSCLKLCPLLSHAASDSNPTFSHPTSKSEEKSEEGELEREWKEEEDDKRGEEAKEAGENLTPGGVFAGVGEFPSSHKPERTDTLQLPQLKYKAEAALRYVYACIHLSIGAIHILALLYICVMRVTSGLSSESFIAVYIHTHTCEMSMRLQTLPAFLIYMTCNPFLCSTPK